MLEKAKKSWEELKRDKPGKRFQHRYERKNEADRPEWRKPLMLAIGLVVFLGGIFFLAVPGPGIPIVAIGAAILAEESLAIARALDWFELRIREVIRKAVDLWKRAGAVARAAIVSGTLLLVGAGAYGAWWYVFER